MRPATGLLGARKRLWLSGDLVLGWIDALVQARFLCGLVVLGLFLGALGSARCDFIYWADFPGGDIRRANPDGTGQQTLITGLPSPVGIALDVAGGYMYWTDYGNYGVSTEKVERPVRVCRQANPHRPGISPALGYSSWSLFNGYA